MRNLLILIKGEIIRLFKYKILVIGFVFSLILVTALALSGKEEAQALMPFFLVMDTGMMTIILLASSYYFEKQENTAKSLFVTPVSIAKILFAKITSSLISSIISIVLVGLAMLIFHGVLINFALAILYVVISTLAHVSIGYIIVFNSRDFTSFLMKYMAMVLLLMIPALLVLLKVIGGNSEYFALLSPSYAIQFLMGSLSETKEIGKIFVGIIILILVPSLIIPLFVYPKFKIYSTEG